MSTEVIILVTYHEKGLYHSKMELKLVIFYVKYYNILVFYNILVNTFYFHKFFIRI